MSGDTNTKIKKMSKIIGGTQAGSAGVGITGSIIRMTDISKSLKLLLRLL